MLVVSVGMRAMACGRRPVIEGGGYPHIHAVWMGGDNYPVAKDPIARYSQGYPFVSNDYGGSGMRRPDAILL